MKQWLLAFVGVLALSVNTVKCSGDGNVTLTLREDRLDGQYRVCTYDDLGQDYVFTLPRYKQCPRFWERPEYEMEDGG